MPITASTDRFPAEHVSETAAPHPEEMKATINLSIGRLVSVKATVRATLAGLLAPALLAVAVLFPATSGRKTSSAIGKPQGSAKRQKLMERVFIGATRAEATRMADEWWGRQKGLRQTLRTEVAVGGKGPDAQLDQWAITIRYEDENHEMSNRSRPPGR
jgi:hypothetical protein